MNGEPFSPFIRFPCRVLEKLDECEAGVYKISWLIINPLNGTAAIASPATGGEQAKSGRRLAPASKGDTSWNQHSMAWNRPSMLLISVDGGCSGFDRHSLRWHHDDLAAFIKD